MRRNTLRLNIQTGRNLNTKRHKTYISKGQNVKNQNLQNGLQNCFRFTEFVVNHFIDQILLTKCAQELNKRELQKLVNQAMTHCNSYLQNQNWQLNPYGPHQLKKNQVPLQLDPEPQCRIFDPMLSLQKQKIQIQSKISSQNSLSAYKFKKNSHKFDRKSIFINQNTSRQSIRSNTSRLSKANFSFQNQNLVPLRFQNGITPQLTTRRTLQDFLREKKINADVNLGYKIRNYSEDKQNLKTILEFPKSSFLMNTVRNFPPLNQNETKLPHISIKDDLNTDYDGNAIPMKKTSNLKKKTQILKMVCKVKQQNHEASKNNVHSKYFKPEQIKLKPINCRKDSTSSNTFTMRLNTEEDMKSLIQNGLYTNRIKFHEQEVSNHQQVHQLNQIKH